VALYGVTIFSAAFLLFQVQPIIAKYILPWYGGSQAVWTISLLFFQFFLLLGYLYAHILRKLKSEKVQAGVHVMLLVAALFALPIVPGDHWRAEGGADPTWQILGLLTATLGLPYLLLASTSPLVQSWIAAPGGRSPYRFYALSNLGSLIGLVTYPFIVEPNVARSVQAAGWSWGMGGFVVLGIAAALRSMKRTAPVGAAGKKAGGEPPPPDMRTIAFWILLPALASVFLLSTTNRLVQDLVAIPFLWILPLTIYLMSFIITFDRPAWYSRKVFVALMALSFGGVLWISLMSEDPPLLVSIAVHLVALFAGCMLCHGEVVRMKPSADHLTRFYLYLSGGGALGGFLVAVVAPMVFDDYLEYPLVMVLIPLALMAAVTTPAKGKSRRGILKTAALYPLAAGLLAVGAFAVGLYAARSAAGMNAVARARNFYGTLTVAEYDRPGTRGSHRTMRHGRILHGLQYLHSDLEHLPTAYFTSHGGGGMTIRNFPRPEGRGLKIGVIGLGVGTIAAWAEPGDTVKFYEINPDVERLARRYFTYLAKCRGTAEVAIGDARLVLEREPPQQFDVFVVDAFNNDSPPLHLLTREAFQLYFRHLRPDGAIAAHITSKYINFVPVISAIADGLNCPWTTVFDFNREDEYLRTQSFWVILTRNAALQANREILNASNRPDVPPTSRVWTDDYSSLFEIVEW